MGAAVSADVDVKAIEHLDFEPCCEARVTSPEEQLFGSKKRACPNHATWLTRCRGCKHAWLSCDEHRDEVLSYQEIRCALCGGQDAPLKQFQFVPIGGTR